MAANGGNDRCSSGEGGADADGDPLDALVSTLSQNPELIALIERQVAEASGANAAAATTGSGTGAGTGTSSGAGSGGDGPIAPSDEVARRVVRSVLLERYGGASTANANTGAPATSGSSAAGQGQQSQPQQQQRLAPSTLSAASLGGGTDGGLAGTGTSTGPPPVKTVTFSTISVPDDDDEEDYSFTAGGGGGGGGSNVESSAVAGSGAGSAAAASGGIGYPRRDSNDEYGYDGEVDGEGGSFQAMRRSRGRSASPPPPRFPSLLDDGYHYPRDRDRDRGGAAAATASAAGNSRSRGRSCSPTTLSLGMSSVTSGDVGGIGFGGTSAGENTASGDESSVTSAFSRGSRSSRGSRNALGGNASVTFAPRVSFGSAASAGAAGAAAVAAADGSNQQPQQQQQHVHFSAMNPNPHLDLDGASSPGEGYDGDDNDQHHGDATNNDDAAAAFGSGNISGGIDVDAEARARSRALAQRVGRAAVRSRGRSRSRSPPPPHSSFPAVSWEDGSNTPPTANAGAGAGSRGSRSGLSSPAIEPSLSPLSAGSRGRRSGSIQFNNEISVIETITEAADRLRIQEGTADGNGVTATATATAADTRRTIRRSLSDTSDPEGPRSPPGTDTASPSSGGEAFVAPVYQRTSSGRVVHFSAMRDVAVVDTEHPAEGSLHSGGIVAVEHAAAAAVATAQSNATTSTSGASASSSVVHFADDVSESASAAASEVSHHLPAEGLPGYRTATFQSESDLERAADRLRRLIRRAEIVGSMTLEEAFDHFDTAHRGMITPADLREGLARLGESFAAYSIEDCTALIEYWARISTGAMPASSESSAEAGLPKMTLLGFFRAMGRHSPPPALSGTQDEAENEDDNGGGDNDNEGINASDSAGLPVSQSTPSLPVPRRRHVSSLVESPVVHAHQAAERLRSIVLRAEREEGRPLSYAFRLLDPDGNGYVDAEDFRQGLRRLGRSDGDVGEETKAGDEVAGSAANADNGDGDFSSIDEEDCEELVALFDNNSDGLVSLLDFYRFMGRYSPPPEATATSGTAGSSSESDDINVAVDDAGIGADGGAATATW